MLAQCDVCTYNIYVAMCVLKNFTVNGLLQVSIYVILISFNIPFILSLYALSVMMQYSIFKMTVDDKRSHTTLLKAPSPLHTTITYWSQMGIFRTQDQKHLISFVVNQEEKIVVLFSNLKLIPEDRRSWPSPISLATEVRISSARRSAFMRQRTHGKHTACLHRLAGNG